MLGQSSYEPNTTGNRGNMRKAIVAVVFLCTGYFVVAQQPEDEIEYRVLKVDDALTAFEDGPTPRMRVRANFYRGKDDDPWHTSPGQVSIEHGLPAWKEEYSDLFAGLPAGKRWRMGSNYWSNLSSSFSLSGPGGRLPAGYYYLVLEKGDGDAWKLVFLSPSGVRQLQIDPWHVNRQDSGVGAFELDLTRTTLAQPTEKLEIRLALQDENPRSFRIDIRFGPTQLTSSLVSVDLN